MSAMDDLKIQVSKVVETGELVQEALNLLREQISVKDQLLIKQGQTTDVSMQLENEDDETVISLKARGNNNAIMDIVNDNDEPVMEVYGDRIIMHKPVVIKDETEIEGELNVRGEMNTFDSVNIG